MEKPPSIVPRSSLLQIKISAFGIFYKHTVKNLQGVFKLKDYCGKPPPEQDSRAMQKGAAPTKQFVCFPF